MGGTLEYLSGLLGGSGGHGHKKKRKQLQTVELKVRMDCEGCELKVKNALSSLKGSISLCYFCYLVRRTNLSSACIMMNLDACIHTCMYSHKAICS